ncbi:MAG: hypothetical protein ABSE56_14525 [Bryobacteraceae bacterium]|jgi:hypothetical protein
MADERELVTVFRSADSDAEDQAAAARDLLTQAGLSAETFDDSTPGVPAGAFEVRVPPEQQAEAERLIDSQREPSGEPPDLSPDLDMVPVFASDAAEAEMLATQIRSILEARDIPSVLTSGSMFPSLPFEVRVPKIRLEEARQAIVEAQEAGPAAAEEGERESEAESGGSEGGV